MCVDRTSMELSILYLKGSLVEFLEHDAFLSLRFVLSLQTMQILMKCRYAPFHQVFAVCQSTYSLFSFLTSFAIALMGNGFGSFTIIVLCMPCTMLAVLLVGLQCVIVVFSDHARLLFRKVEKYL